MNSRAIFERSHIGAVALIVASLVIAATVGSPQHPKPAAPLPPGIIGAVDAPAAEAVVGTAVHVTGWALDPAGVRGVEVRVDGRPYAAQYGIARSDVGQVRPGYPDSDASGFVFDGELAPLTPERHEFTVVAINRGGAELVLARKSLIPQEALAEWKPLYEARNAAGTPPFYVLPGASGISLGGATELDAAYTPYLSPTLNVGMRVPILYLRTTLGAARDWVFDPDWNIERKCGTRRIAEDSLSAVISYAVAHKIPVLFTLNGGIWADAACDVPEWDLNDHLEADKANCQWNEHDQVMPDDYLKNLAGASDSPELARSLSFNVYATQYRSYKRRNLQAAGRVIVAFAKAHPELFAGVNLDPDTYTNPFFGETQWYDYNPGTLRQFRQWLAGSGPYAGQHGRDVPNLSRYRRHRPLSLADVRKLAGKPFRTWDQVDPPRTFPREGKPFWLDPWMHEWEVFKRHLVHVHYDEMAHWLAEIGMPTQRIFSSQGFIAPYPTAFPFALHVDSPSKNYDSGGMSVEGAIPHDGHLGAIVYGASAVNDVRVENDGNLFAIFHQMDPGWAVVEFNTADFRTADQLPTYAMGYRALREMFNYGARLASPMAWNGSNGIHAGKPGYVSFMAWRNTPLEDAMKDFAVSHAFVPLGARLWTFGSANYADNDGWTGEAGTSLAPGNGYIDLRSAGAGLVLLSPENLALAPQETDLMVIAADPADSLARIGLEARTGQGPWIGLGPPRDVATLEQSSAGTLLPIAWPDAIATVDQFRLVLETRGKGAARIRHVALYPAGSARGERALIVK
jgi:hypothetical protein